MNASVVKNDTFLANCIVDVLLLSAACVIPAVSHLVGFSVGVFNPMLLLLLGGMLLVSDHRNAYFLALLMPLCSYLLVGMPSFSKMICLCGELTAVVACFSMLSTKMRAFPAILLSLFAAKGIYYGLKLLLLDGALVATPFAMQLPVMLLAASVFAFCFRKIER
ncbi:MAG: hypothetical protein KBT45_01725 [Bacteroidales bacterium]|nr:hypothetical protein [Candidatus Colimorpha pelethequi]